MFTLSKMYVHNVRLNVSVECQKCKQNDQNVSCLLAKKCKQSNQNVSRNDTNVNSQCKREHTNVNSHTTNVNQNVNQEYQNVNSQPCNNYIKHDPTILCMIKQQNKRQTAIKIKQIATKRDRLTLLFFTQSYQPIK